MDLHEEIAKLAYELYEKGGRPEGKDLENWCDAERIVLARSPGRKSQGAKRQRRPLKEKRPTKMPEKSRREDRKP